jgi:hypothetical protein
MVLGTLIAQEIQFSVVRAGQVINGDTKKNYEKVESHCVLYHNYVASNSSVTVS